MPGNTTTDPFKKVGIRDGTNEEALPEWGRVLIWIGSWCRELSIPGKRLVTIALVPARGVSTAFIGLGALLAGVRSYSGDLSWPRFRGLPAGTTVYWRPPTSNRSYQGKVLGFETIGYEEYIRVAVVRAPRRADEGVELKVGRPYFEQYRFRQDAPPTGRGEAATLRAARAYREILGGATDAWIRDDGADALLVTRMSEFDVALDGLWVVPDGREAVAMRDMLVIARAGDASHGKLRVTHPRGEVSLNCPLAILEGLEAFDVREHVRATNLLFVLERTEYSAAVSNWVAAVRSQSEELPSSLLSKNDGPLPAGIELASYMVSQ